MEQGEQIKYLRVIFQANIPWSVHLNSVTRTVTLLQKNTGNSCFEILVFPWRTICACINDCILC